MALSTPAGRGGWFFEACRDAARYGSDYRWKLTGSMCLRMSKDQLEESAAEDLTRAHFADANISASSLQG